MAGNVCAYFNCDRTRRVEKTLSMFRFPLKDRERARKWIINCGNIVLEQLSEEELHKRVVCEHHFLESDFINRAGVKTRLKLTAVPQSYKQTAVDSNSGISPKTLEVIKPTNIYSEPSRVKRKLFIEEHSYSSSPSSTTDQWLQDLIDMPSSPKKMKMNPTVKLKHTIENQKEEIKRLNNKILLKNKKIALQASQISKWKSKMRIIKSSMPVEMQIQNMDFLMKWSRTVIKMQLKRSHRKWYNDEKQFALCLFYKSPNAYRYLRRHIVLPSESTIKMWIGQSKFLTGINSKYKRQLMLKVQSMSEEEKDCVLSFDEMALKECLEYSRTLDFIEGYEDMGHLGRTQRTAKHALVFMARGLFSSWKLPLAYYLSHTGAPAEYMKDILQKVLKVCFQCGLRLKAIVCDQGANNQKLYRLLGVTKDCPNFEFDLDGEKKNIVAIFDILHLMKNFRNNLLNGRYVFQGKFISMDDVRIVYELDKNKKCRALVKLTDKHLNPTNFQKMNVKLATQVLSHSVSSAIRTCVETREIQTTSAETTAEFIDFIDKVFDYLNSKRFQGQKLYNSALHKKHPIVEKTLKDAIIYFDELLKIKSDGTLSRPPCFDGMIQTINGVLSGTHKSPECKIADP